MSARLTLVSAFLELAPLSYSAEKAFLRNFELLASTEIPMCIYLSCGAVAKVASILRKHPHIKIMGIVSLHSTQCALAASCVDCKALPANRNTPKDTLEYILLMNAKTEFMRKAITANPFGSTHFAWADFRLAHVFGDPARSCAHLRDLARATLAPSFLAIPGCRASVEDGVWNNKGVFADNILWRFCGGFFIGDKNSVLKFADMHTHYFDMFIQTFGTVAWEVNIWAWMETYSRIRAADKTQTAAAWRPDWFAADHNDSIIAIPARFFAARVVLYSTRMIDYTLPPVAPGFRAGSMSVVVEPGPAARRIANVRHVNYTLTDHGAYLFSDPNGVLSTRNMCYELGEDWVPVAPGVEMHVCGGAAADELPTYPGKFLGLEDMRLFVRTDKQIGCISSSVEHSATGESRMVVGRYDMSTNSVRECEVLAPPANVGGWQKNWAPVPGGLFVYGWNPFEVGMVVDGKLCIEYSYSIASPIFAHARGSTPFVPRTSEPGELVGLVHFSEGSAPRQYFHILVVLDALTFKPLRRSEVFVFESIGVEFCIGMFEDGKHYRWWASRFDRDPAMFEVPASCLPLDIPMC
jgi:hypothetical protein